jgi:hypothetical protein
MSYLCDMANMKFNTNSYVYVKLTQKGIDMLIDSRLENDMELRRNGYAKHIPLTTREELRAIIDANCAQHYGYYEMQFWNMCQKFGSEMYNGAELCFDTEIIFDKEALEETSLQAESRKRKIKNI